MCGIAGIAALTDKGTERLPRIRAAVDGLRRRGPDADGIFTAGRVALAHTRLSVIDTSSLGAQPMSDPTGRYTIVFNGEFFNYREHRDALSAAGVSFRSHSDTEVLLQLYLREGPACLQKVNGFFALALYDSREETVFLARDRMGIKPLLVAVEPDAVVFGSELKALLAMGVAREMDTAAVHAYFQLNYIPEPYSILKGVRKLQPGTYMTITPGRGNEAVREHRYYRMAETGMPPVNVRDEASVRSTLYGLLDRAVERRLVSDVPLGAFLSGGIDSSVIVALAAGHTPHLNTFSIGFRDDPFFDETGYAEMVAEKYKTNHRSFRLTTDDLLQDLVPALDYLDEPFGDSSALAVHILSRETRRHVTVALSGDGGDELFGGYLKHQAEYMARHPGFAQRLAAMGLPLWKLLPQSRNTPFGNRIRQLRRFAEGMRLSPPQRYWRWASLMTGPAATGLLAPASPDIAESTLRRDALLEGIRPGGDLNDVLRTDMRLVLPGDMLRKVDAMSMANSLEVRVPLLDYTVVDFAFSLPSSFKVDAGGRKKILRETFGHLLPSPLLERGKKGFEVPLYRWFNGALKSTVNGDLLSEGFLREQGVFDPAVVARLKSRLFSTSPGDATGQVWALLAFQHWWKKYFSAS
jgi:asparagine synthase (glutamine-hydrolysing)